jgi:hypothetical protein
LATGPPTKFMVLEGIGTIFPKGHPEKTVTVHGGEMVMMTADKKITQPEKFDVKLVLETSPLIVDFPPLANLPLILTVMNQQLAAQQLAGTTSQALVRNLIDVVAVTDQNANSNPILVAVRTTTPAPRVTPTPSITPPPTPTPSITPPPTPTPSITPPPTPSKFGTPTTITSPNPYLITGGTVITTDPSITTNGVTNFGTIYRGQADDGAFTVWAFGSTSAFDTALGIDNVFFADPSHLSIATFKFQSLSLTGNPTIHLSNDGGTKLALIGVDGITSGSPGGTLTFTGLDLLMLATVNGSINLTSDVSFQNLSELAMYARGASSDLILDSPISNIGILDLAAEGSIQLTNPGTMSVGELDAAAGSNLTLQIGGSLLTDGKVRFETLVLSGTTVATGGNLTLNVTGDYANSSATEFSSLLVMNEGAHIETGGNIAVNIGGNLTATGLGSATGFPEPGDFEAVVQNTNGQIDNGGNLNLTVTGNVLVNGLGAFLQNYDETANPAGHIGTGGNIDIEIGGNFTANSYVDVFLNNNAGGVIDSGGNLTFNIGGALTIGGDAGGVGLAGASAEFVISNRYDDSAGNTTPPVIGSDVSLFLHAASINMAGILLPSGISNALGGVIDGNATATWDVPGNVMIQGTTPIADLLSGASWVITNDVPAVYQFAPPSGGTIHGSATLTLNIGGDLTVAGDASIEIENQRNAQSTVPRGGTIDSDATVNLTAANFSVGGELDVDIRNRNNGIGSGTGGGTIGQNAAINLTLSGDLTTTGTDRNSGGVPGNAYFYIANESDVGGSGGFIGSDATINLQAGSISTAGLLDVEIDNFSGGSIGGNAAINVTTDTLSVSGSLGSTINNSNSGTIGGNATINMNVSGSATVTNDAVFQILGSGGAASAAINFNGGSYDAGGTFLAFIDRDGTITFNNASAHADVLKVGALGTNGVLNIGGGTLSADTTLELYAPGSKGQLNFVSNVTLGGNSIKILAANSVTIFNNIVVTIGGSNPAHVYTNNANYTGFGGNGTTTGTFAGAGANNPLPLSQAPPFGPSSSVPPTVTHGGGTLPSGRRTGGTINVNNTAELLALLDGGVVGPDGRITIPDSKSAASRREPNQTSISRLSRLEHQLAIQRIRDRGITRVGGGKVAAAQ